MTLIDHSERSCDCPGCSKCPGFVAGCECDIDLPALREVRKRIRELRKKNREDSPPPF